MSDQINTKHFDGNSLPEAGKSDSILIEILSYLYYHKYLILTIGLLTFGFISVEHRLFPQYKATSRLNIQTPELSTLLSATAKISGIQQSGGYGYSDYAEKYLLLLETSRFYGKLSKNILQQDWLDTYLYEAKKASYPKWIRAFLSSSFFKVSDERADQEDLVNASIGRWIQFRKINYDSINIIAITPDKLLSSQLANLVSEAVIHTLTNYELLELKEAEDYLDSEIKNSGSRIGEFENSIAEAKSKNQSPAFSINITSNEVFSASKKIKQELAITQVEVGQNKLLIEALSAKLRKYNGPEDKNMGDFAGGLTSRLRNLRSEGEILKIRNIALRQTLKNLLKYENQATSQKIYEMKRHLEMEYSLFQMLKRQLFDIRVQKIAIKNRIRVYDDATLNSAARKTPFLTKLIIALSMTFLISGVIIFIWEQIHPKVNSKKDLSQMGLHFLGGVTDLASEATPLNRLKYRKKNTSSDILCRFDVDSLGATTFRYIRTRLLQIMDGGNQPMKVLSIVSPAQGDGKSVISANLALSLSGIGKKTLFIDADLRRWSYTNLFGFKVQEGLPEVLVEGKKIEDVVIKDVQPNLDVMCSGAKNTQLQDAFAGKDFEKFINRAKEIYDVVIIDTPAFRSGPEAFLATKQADITVIVTRAGLTNSRDLRELVNDLASLQFNKIFSILNGSNERFLDDTYILPYVLPSQKNVVSEDDLKSKRNRFKKVGKG